MTALTIHGEPHRASVGPHPVCAIGGESIPPGAWRVTVTGQVGQGRFVGTACLLHAATPDNDGPTDPERVGRARDRETTLRDALA